MKITYDSDTDSLYIALADEIDDGAATETREIVPGFMIDLDASGRVLGIEILDAHGCVNLTTLLGEGMPLTDTEAGRGLADLGGTQRHLEATSRRRPV